MRAGQGAWLRFAAVGVLIAAWGCGPEFQAGTTGMGGSGPSTGGAGGTGGTGGTGGAGGGTGGAGGSTCTQVDNDGDGSDDCLDCDDADPLTYPGAPEICGDAVANGCEGESDPFDVCQGVGTFVSETGDDGNAGTKAEPVRTIAKGIENAVAIQSAGMAAVGVYVAQGEYAESVALVEGVSLFGGHSAADWTRDPAMNTSLIDCSTFVCVRADETISRATVVDGFTIQGRGGQPASPPGSVAVQLDGGALTLRNNQILGGAVNTAVNNAKNSIGVQIVGPNAQGGPLIEGNRVTADQANEISAAVVIETQAEVEIRGNQLRGGTGAQSYGVLDKGTPGATIENNEIQAGSATTGHAFGMLCRGKLAINANRINADLAAPPTCQSASLWCGGIASYSSQALITNNVLFGASADASTAMYLTEQEKAAQQLVLNSNYLDGLGKAAPGASTRSAAIVLHSPYAGQANAFVGFIRNNILMGGRNTQRFGVYEETSPNQTCSPSAFDNNLFYFATQAPATDVLYRDYSNNASTLILTIASLPPGYANNQAADPRVDADFHLMSDSPCIDAGSSEQAPDLDFEGDERPQGQDSKYDIGPDEAAP